MICKEKMFLVAGNVDDSIKSQTTVYDITLFKSFVDFEKFVNERPVIINTLIITTNELQFTNTNMIRVMNILSSPFMTIKGSVVYLIDQTYDISRVNEFLNGKGITDWAVYQGNLTNKFISDIVSGEGRQTVEGQVDIVTYRVRASEYIKQQQNQQYESSDDVYVTDEDWLSGIPDEEEPVELKPTLDVVADVNYIVGANCTERTLFAFLLAQYRSLTSKTIIVEKDYEYHRLTELVTKTGIDCEMITVTDLSDDITRVLQEIRATSKQLIVIGCIERINYSYNFLTDILYSNLKSDIACFVRECDYEETPYGRTYTIVVQNTVPDVIKCCNALKYAIVPEDVTFIGLQLGSLGPVNITSQEMRAIIEQILRQNSVSAQVMRASGSVLRGEGVLYDILGSLNRRDRR